MKVALDISPLSSGHSIRGTGFYVSELLHAIQNEKPENIQLITFSNKKDIPSDVDIIHIPYFDPFFVQLDIRTISKTVVTIHDLTPILLPDLFPAGVKGNIKWKINRYLLNHAKGIIVPTQKIKEDVMAIIGAPPERVYVTEEGYGKQFYPISNKKKIDIVLKKYHLPQSYIVYLGDVTPNKNLPRLVRAAIDARVNLVMVGKALTTTDFDRTNAWNNDLMYVQEYAKNHKNIYLTGFIPDEDLNVLLNGATALTMVSLYEGFGLPVVQAMACGIPVVVSNEGSLPEVAGNAAMYVNAYSEKDIAEGLKKITFDTKLQKKLGNEGLVQVKKFSWKKAAQLTIRAYEECNKK